MKIGILTHHYVKNYGAFLQMKGMYEALAEVYPDAEIYIINFIVKKHWIKNILHVLHYRKGIDTIGTYIGKVKQLFVFSKYERSFPRTAKVTSSSEIENLKLDLLVFGSDEIWNIHGSGYDPLKFAVGLNKSTIITYAPSAGAVTDETVVPEVLNEGFNNFSRISVRDDETLKFVKRVAGKDAVKMLDPTFLYNFDIDIEKEGIAEKNFKYILVYDCKLTPEMEKSLRAYADENGLKIIGAGDYKKFYDEVTINLTPYEWVSLFKYAEKVVTGTFHGTVFSLKYDKDFVCYPTEKNRINKIKSLLSDMGMTGRLLNIGEEAELTKLLATKADYEFAHQYIEVKKTRAKDFLAEI